MWLTWKQTSFWKGIETKFHYLSWYRISKAKFIYLNFYKFKCFGLFPSWQCTLFKILFLKITHPCNEYHDFHSKLKVPLELNIWIIEDGSIILVFILVSHFVSVQICQFSRIPFHGEQSCIKLRNSDGSITFRIWNLKIMILYLNPNPVYLSRIRSETQPQT